MEGLHGILPIASIFEVIRSVLHPILAEIRAASQPA
jgi:hypothetical protein